MNSVHNRYTLRQVVVASLSTSVAGGPSSKAPCYGQPTAWPSCREHRRSTRTVGTAVRRRASTEKMGGGCSFAGP